MANTRIVTGPINVFLDDDPWDGFEVHIKLTPAVYGSTATYPERTEVVHTDADGDFAIELVTGVRYKFMLVGAFAVQGRRTVYGDRNIVTTVVPHGDTPISLATCVAMSTDPDPDPDLAALANAHLGRVDNPHSVTAAQTGAYTTGQVDSLLLAKTDDSTLAPVAKSGDASDLANDVPFLVGADIAHFVPDSRTINGHDLTSDVTLTKTDVGLGNVDNTSDAAKPLSTAATNALALKADDATLSGIAKTGSADDLADGASNVAMTTGERSKLAGIEVGAQVNVQADWDAVAGDAYIQHKPVLGTAAATDASDYATAGQGAKADTALQPTDGDYLANTAARHSHANKATLDTIAPTDLIPTGASRVHQVVSWDGTAPAWRDAPRAVEPIYLVLPNESRNRDGAFVTSVVGGGTDYKQILDGVPVWSTTGSKGIRPPNDKFALTGTAIREQDWTFIFWAKFRSVDANRRAYFLNHSSNWPFSPGIDTRTATGISACARVAEPPNGPVLVLPPTGGWATIAVVGRGRSNTTTYIEVYRDGQYIGISYTGQDTKILDTHQDINLAASDFAGLIWYDRALTPQEVADFAAIPMPERGWWSLRAHPRPTPLHLSLGVNAKVAAGGATLRVAPGAATQAVATLAAADLVHDTGKTINDSGTDYQFVQTEWGGGYVAQSKLTSL